jgi:hypothetical protein
MERLRTALENAHSIDAYRETVIAVMRDRDRLLDLARRVAAPGSDEQRIEGTLAIVLEARALVRLIDGGSR